MQAGWGAGLRASSIDNWAAGYVIGSPPTCRKRIFAIISLVAFLELHNEVSPSVAENLLDGAHQIFRR
jgi:hypothetical protein